jgi:hypothetical protein
VVVVGAKLATWATQFVTRFATFIDPNPVAWS